MNTDTPAKKNWAYIFSPCVILAIFFGVIACIYAMERGERGEARAYMVYAILLMVPALIISLLIDFGIRFCLKKANVKKKALYIWLIEMIVIVFAFGLIWAWALAAVHF
ncbi:hypothetical protein [Chitinophaga ginsengisoli]|uniref:Uncharacterized protein n=1 Tax=Chitinophaga ginsengisoli TaxID=363837 RepID=A0A2P8G2Z9_9BACT|nr:hypothetical protein [Chitinophaga ginsengisoli]PSL28255.1 hypothetical protein CLV42_108174 [Chitinophaga ginsengisoli]